MASVELAHARSSANASSPSITGQCAPSLVVDVINTVVLLEHGEGHLFVLTGSIVGRTIRIGSMLSGRRGRVCD